MPFSASAVFLFHLFHIGKTFPFEDFFIQGNKIKSLGQERVNREGGAWGSCCFLVKSCSTLNTLCGQMCSKITNHEMGYTLKVSSKEISLKSNEASHNSSWYTDTDGFLEHSPSRGGLVLQEGNSLQKIIPFGGGVGSLHISRKRLSTHYISNYLKTLKQKFLTVS